MRAILFLSLRFRYLVIAGAVALMFFGVQTLGHQKVDVFPEFAPITVEIQTEASGLSPSEVESLITVPARERAPGRAASHGGRVRVGPAALRDLPVLQERDRRAPGPPAGPGAARRGLAVAAVVGGAAGAVPDRLRDEPRDAGRDHARRRSTTSTSRRSRSSRSGRGCCTYPASPTSRCGARRRRRSRSTPIPSKLQQQNVSLGSLMTAADNGR